MYVGEHESSLLNCDCEVFGKLPAHTSADPVAGCGEQVYSFILPPRTIGIHFWKGI